MDKNNEQGACNGEQHEDPVDNMDEEAAAKEKLTSDPNKVKFTSVNLDCFDGKNGEAKVDIYVAQTTVGMGKEELMKYANEPFWVRLRMFLFVFFWIAWLAMLVGAVVIILLAPRCPPAPRLEWYQKTAMYEVDVKTFKDSNGDGVGDLKGLISELDYFKTQNIGTVLLSSFYESDDNGGITDHMKIDSKIGTIADFEELLSEMNAKDIKLVIDFNPNHSSDQHQWFIDSIEKENHHEDFYVWANEDNKWLNVDSDSAWTWNEKRQQYYLGIFGKNKPDLNLRNEGVQEELKNILRFWLDKGVHGFKVVAASHLFEDARLREEPVGTETGKENPSYEDIMHMYTVDQRENFDLFAEWKEVISNYTQISGLHKILIAEVSGSVNTTVPYYKSGNQTLADLVFNTQMAEFNEESNATDLKDSLESWSKVSVDTWPTFLVGSGKTKRLASRVGDDLVDAIHMAVIIAKGTPITYYGDELGMVDLESPKGNGMLPQSVMLWSNEANAGFSNGSTTLPINRDYETVNVQAQKLEKQSHLNIFKNLLALRGQPALSFGFQEYPVVNKEIFSMIRVRKGSPGYLVVINFSANSTVVDFSEKSDYLPDLARVEIRSRNLKSGPLFDGEHPKISLNHVPLDPKQSVVFSFVPQFKG